MRVSPRDSGPRAELDAAPAGRALEVIALHTADQATLRALKTAAALAADLAARIRLLAPVVVPFPLPLEEPAVRPEVLAERLDELAREACVDCVIDIRLCRERGAALRQALPAGSIVVIGEVARWWRIGERRLGAELMEAGHSVAFAPGGMANG